MALTPLAADTAAATGMVAGAGTGLGGRVRAQDLVAPGATPAAAGATLAPAAIDEAPEEVAYKGIRKLIGDRMMGSLNDHAQLTLNSSADATQIMAMRKKLKSAKETLGIPNISLNDMVCAAVAWTLPKYPEVNGMFQRDTAKFLKYKQAHLAIAIDTERGLMVPVIPNADKMSLGQIAVTIADYAGQCRGGSINPDLLNGGTFTISNLGAMGIESFTPVLNSPQVAILGVCAITQTPVPDKEKGFRFVPKIGLSLTIDHQVVDGAPAAKFLKAVADAITNFDVTMATQGL
jgi:pyruvate dehydrogenase E2 component (dihydrolipoamide acetyltransferase)